MFQSYALFPHMTVARNIAYGLEMEKLPKDEIAARVDEILSHPAFSISPVASPTSSPAVRGSASRLPARW